MRKKEVITFILCIFIISYVLCIEIMPVPYTAPTHTDSWVNSQEAEMIAVTLVINENF